MFKRFFNGLEKAKILVTELSAKAKVVGKNLYDRYVPVCAKSEIDTMITGNKMLQSQIKENFKTGSAYDRLHKNGLLSVVSSGTGAVLANTKITKENVPSLFAMAATPIPFPLTSPIAYALGRVATSDRAVNVYKNGKKVLSTVCPFM